MSDRLDRAYDRYERGVRICLVVMAFAVVVKVLALIVLIWALATS